MKLKEKTAYDLTKKSEKENWDEELFAAVIYALGEYSPSL
jgi:hypothetical protein